MRVRDSEIIGEVMKLDGDYVVLWWTTNGHAQQWIGEKKDLIPVMGDDFFGNCSNCVDW